MFVKTQRDSTAHPPLIVCALLLAFDLAFDRVGRTLLSDALDFEFEFDFDRVERAPLARPLLTLLLIVRSRTLSCTAT